MTRGGSRGRVKRSSLSSLSRARLATHDLDAFILEVVQSSDRACALLATASVDNALQDLIAAHMRDDWPGLADAVFRGVAAPLHSFHACITIAYALELISDSQRAQLLTIQEVRNTFAHSETLISFSHPDMKAECLTLPAPGGIVPISPRNNFVSACIGMRVTFLKEAAAQQNNMALVRALRNYKPQIVEPSP